MPFTLIKGKFHVKGRSPDGDTISFSANNKRNWRKLSGPNPRLNSQDITSLRFEAIDTLETHFKGTRQPNPHADAATDLTLASANVTGVVWGMRNGERTRVTSANDEVPGYILSRAVEKFGRPVSFVFAGTVNKPDGSSQFLDVTWLKQSINFKLISSGLAYPTYYEAMCRFIDLRDALTAEAVKAFNSNKGLWPEDESSGLVVNNAMQLETNSVIMPKLFRRLVEYLPTNGNNVRGFKEWLEMRQEQVLVLAPDMMGRMTTLDELIFEDGKRIGLITDPENLIFKP